jgi:hypothetical protein
LSVEDWAEIRRLHRAEGLAIKLIARTLGISRNTVRAAITSDGPPKYERKSAGSIVDTAEPRIRELLTAYPTMPATVIAERIGWDRGLTVLKDRIRELRPAYLPPDPASRTAYAAGEIAQCDFWFPPVSIPAGQPARGCQHSSTRGPGRDHPDLLDPALDRAKLQTGQGRAGLGRLPGPLRYRDPPPPGPGQLRILLLLGRLVCRSPATAGACGTAAGGRPRREGGPDQPWHPRPHPGPGPSAPCAPGFPHGSRCGATGKHGRMRPRPRSY